MLKGIENIEGYLNFLAKRSPEYSVGKKKATFCVRAIYFLLFFIFAHGNTGKVYKKLIKVITYCQVVVGEWNEQDIGEKETSGCMFLVL